MKEYFTIGTLRGGVRHFTGLSANRCPVMGRTSTWQMWRMAEIIGTVRDLLDHPYADGWDLCKHCKRAANRQAEAEGI